MFRVPRKALAATAAAFLLVGGVAYASTDRPNGGSDTAAVAEAKKVTAAQGVSVNAWPVHLWFGSWSSDILLTYYNPNAAIELPNLAVMVSSTHPAMCMADNVMIDPNLPATVTVPHGAGVLPVPPPKIALKMDAPDVCDGMTARLTVQKN